jgi:hypothetical protein
MNLESWRKRFKEEINQEFRQKEATQDELKNRLIIIVKQRRKIVKDLLPRVENVCKEFCIILKWRIFDYSSATDIRLGLGVYHSEGPVTPITVHTWPNDDTFRAPLSLCPELDGLKGTEDWLNGIVPGHRWGNPQQLYPIQGITVRPDISLDASAPEPYLSKQLQTAIAITTRLFPNAKPYSEEKGFTGSGSYYVRTHWNPYPHVNVCRFITLHHVTTIQLATALEEMYKGWREYLQESGHIPSKGLMPEY